MSENFVTCQCRHCDGHIEFDASDFAKGETRTVECPHCKLETIIFVPIAPKPSPAPPSPKTQSLKGTVLDFAIQTNAGIISGDDGQRYSFQGAEWRDNGKFPAKGMRVDFSPQADSATAIYLIQDVAGATQETKASKYPRPAPKKGVMQFQNPANGFVEEVAVGNAQLCILLFGCFYLAVKGIWTHAAASALAAFLTCGLSWLIYPLFAEQIMRTHYLRKGWVAV